MRDLVQKALYLGVGLASYAAEKAGSNLQELKSQAQKLADELVERGEMTTDEAKRYVEELLQEAQTVTQKADNKAMREPRRIEIVEDEEGAVVSQTPPSQTPSAGQDAEALRQQVSALQEELERLRRSS